jgi:hypothetical protein
LRTAVLGSKRQYDSYAASEIVRPAELTPENAALLFEYAYRGAGPGWPAGVARNGASKLSSSGTGECGSMAARCRRDSSHRAWRVAVSLSRIGWEAWAYRPRIPGI